MFIINYIGWLGSFIAILSSLLLSFGFIKKESIVFSVSMFLASIIFVITSFNISNYQAVISNTFFAFFSLISLMGILLKFKFINLNTMFITGLLALIISSYNYFSLNDFNWIIQSIGWIPVVFMPFTFLLFTQNKISNKKYFKLNSVSHSVFFIHLFFVGNYPVATLQIVSLIISIFGLAKKN